MVCGDQESSQGCWNTAKQLEPGTACGFGLADFWTPTLPEVAVSEVGKASVEGGKGWGNRDKIFPVRSGGDLRGPCAGMRPGGVFQFLAPTSQTSALFPHSQSPFSIEGTFCIIPS